MGGGGDILEEEPLEVRVAFISYPQWTLCYAVRSGSRRPPLHPRVSVFRLPTAARGRARGERRESGPGARFGHAAHRRSLGTPSPPAGPFSG